MTLDFNVCLAGFALGLFAGAMASLLYNIISGLFGIMKG